MDEWAAKSDIDETTSVMSTQTSLRAEDVVRLAKRFRDRFEGEISALHVQPLTHATTWRNFRVGPAQAPGAKPGACEVANASASVERNPFEAHESLI